MLQYRRQRRVQRHKEQIEDKLTECIKLLSIIQELKLTEGEDEQSTMDWTTEREKKHHDWDNVIEDLDQHINQLRKDKEHQKKQEEIAIEEDRRSKRREEEEDQWIEKQKRFHTELKEQKLKQLKA